MSCLDLLHDGKSINELGATMTERPPLPSPELRVEFKEVPGRHGSLTDIDAYSDVTFSVEYNVLENKNIKPLIRQIRGFLSFTKTIQFTDDDVYYKVKHTRILEATSEIEEYGLFTVEYVCDPFQYQIDVEDINITKKQIITNTGTVESEPLYIIKGSGLGKLIVNDDELDLIDLKEDEELYLDAELLLAYSKDDLKNNRNFKIHGRIPNLKVGQNSISFSGGITSLTVNGRWRYL